MQKRSKQLTQKKKRVTLDFYMQNHADASSPIVSVDCLCKLRSLDNEKRQLS